MELIEHLQVIFCIQKMYFVAPNILEDNFCLSSILLESFFPKNNNDKYLLQLIVKFVMTLIFQLLI